MSNPYASVARAFYQRHGIGSLFSAPTANPKLEKSLRLRVMSAPLHLAPHTLSGFNVCPKSTAGCRALCLHTAGNPAYMLKKEKARLARTKALFGDYDNFMLTLVYEILALQKKARKAGFKLALRLNATSDIRFERNRFTDLNGKHYANIMERFSFVQFYDYTKIFNRKNIPGNYHLTFSLAENNENDAAQWLEEKRGNVAAVFSTARSKALPATFTLSGFTFPVIDGDLHDLRYIDPKFAIVGLRAKGKAHKSKSKFVRQVTQT